jgi:molybdenum-dependent DNA-binding transcriptional regulator ModE
MNIKERPDEQISLPRAMHTLEACFIVKALEESEGSVTSAARLLGISHQRLCTMLKGRHKGLLEKRKPIVHRLQSIVKEKGARTRGRNFRKIAA